MQDFANFFNEGGEFMWILLGIGAIALAIMVERWIFFKFFNPNDNESILKKVLHSISNGNKADAEIITRKGSSPLHKTLHAATSAWKEGKSFEDISNNVEAASIREVPRLNHRLNVLNLFANIATLTGLLGTIFGLQVSFQSLSMAEGSEKATALANGISQAMNTTAMGLIVAIPCMIAFTRLSAMRKKRTDELDEAIVQTMHAIEKAAQ